MRTWAQKQNQVQKPGAASLARPNMATPGPAHHEYPLLDLQRTIGNQAVQRMLKTDAAEGESGLLDPSSPYFGHDFSRIPIHPPPAAVIQPKLAINKPGEEDEQIAGRVADRVMNMSAALPSAMSTAAPGYPSSASQPQGLAGVLRAYPNNPAARKAMRAQAKCKKAI